MTGWMQSLIFVYNLLIPNFSSTPSPQTKIDQLKHFDDDSPWFHRAIFSYLTNYTTNLKKKRFQREEILPLSRYDKISNFIDSFQNLMKEEMLKNESERSLWRCIFGSLGSYYFIVAMVYYALHVILGFAMIQISNSLIGHYAGRSTMTIEYLYIFVLSLLVIPIVNTICYSQFQVTMSRFAKNMRNLLMAAVYRKIFALGVSARKQFSAGDVINRFSSDLQQLESMFYNIHLIVYCPIQVIFGFILIYRQIGSSAIAGFLVLLLLIPSNSASFASIANLRKKLKSIGDERIKLVVEIMQGIRPIKYGNYEEAFVKKVNEVRARELNTLDVVLYQVAIGTSFIMQCVPIIQPLIIFFVFLSIGNELDSAKVFASLTLFNYIRFPFSFMPMGFNKFVSSQVIADRIMKFLCSEDKTSYVQINTNALKSENNCIKFEDVSLSWADINKSVIKNASFSIPLGALVGVYGKVAAGKSSLLNGLLNEIKLVRGNIILQSGLRIGYYSQIPWIFNGTFKDNILFGQEYDAVAFQKVLKECCLEDDVNALPLGVDSHIGDSGFNLSGGQKARVSLARVLYMAADLLLLDDPFSSVDAHVAGDLFHNCIKLLKGSRTVIVVTHSGQFAKYFDFILKVDDGLVEVIQPKDIDASDNSPANDMAKCCINNHKHTAEFSQLPIATVTKGKLVETDDEVAPDFNSFSMFSYYLAKGRLYMFIAALVVVFLQKSFEVLGTYSIADYSSLSTSSDECFSYSENYQFLFGYALVKLVALCCIILKILLLNRHRIAASTSLHADALHAVLSTRTSFFDNTPVGDVLHKFSTDVQRLDEDLPHAIMQFLNSASTFVGSMMAILTGTKGYMTTALIPLAYIINHLRKRHGHVNKLLHQYATELRSPIYSKVSEAMAGYKTIVANGKTNSYISALEEEIDFNGRVDLNCRWMNQWLSVRIDVIGSFCTFFIGVIGLLNATHDLQLSAAYLGMALTYSLDLTAFLKQSLTMMLNFENTLSSIARLKSYANLESEYEFHGEVIQNLQKEISLFSKGDIVFKNVGLNYNSDPDVLCNVTFAIHSGECVGVLGRTGSGKSSLIAALFGIQPINKGTILLGDVSIHDIPLHKLRKSMGIISQDNTLYSDTLRFNLDPFHQYTDKEIWDALENVGLKAVIFKHPMQLEQRIVAGVDNFSVGERQLLVVARIFLLKPNIIVMDEATSSIDDETDSKLQKLLRLKFPAATLIIIAHRMNTVKLCDKALVMSNGTVVEFDTFQSLLSNQNSYFSQLWKKGLQE